MTVFNWNTSSGAWNVATNWLDLSDGTVTATSPPSAADTAIIDTPAGATITGSGSAAVLGVLSILALQGTVNAGTVTVGTATSFAELGLSAGATLLAAGVTVDGAGLLSLYGSSAVLDASGTLTVGSSQLPSYYEIPDVEVGGGASLRAAGMVLLGGYPAVSVDRTSRLEIGEAGTATAGAMTVDPGAIVSGAGSLAANVINNGTVLAAGGTLSVGTVSGRGTLEIAAGSVLLLSGYEYRVSTAIDFASADATLNVGFATATGTIYGFATGDTIVAQGGGSGVAGWGSADGVGVLTLSTPGPFYEGGPGGEVELNVTLAGDYTGQTFYVLPLPGAAAVVVGAAATSGAAPVGTASGDSYQWTGGNGDWDDAANWQDTTTAADPAVVAPGSLDAVSIQSNTAGSIDLVSGSGNSASLAVGGTVALGGAFQTGALTVGTSAGASGVLEVLGQTSLTAATAVVADGNLLVWGYGADLAVSGGVTLGATGTLAAGGPGINPGSLTVGTYGSMHAARLTMLGDAVLTIDSTSAMDVGPSGTTASGDLSVDSGGTIAGSGVISALIVDNGVIAASGGLLSIMSPSIIFGSGTFAIEPGAALYLSANSELPSVQFDGGDAVLSVGNFINGEETDATGISGVVSGFTFGDTIDVAFAASSADWTAGSGDLGDLIIHQGIGEVRIEMAGDYSGLSFSVTDVGSQAAEITLACLCEGTRILTGRGEIPIERLCEGDSVVTLNGLLPVRWVGRRRLDLSRHPRPALVYPVLIHRGAFEDGQPHRDLLLSPDHAVLVDDVLIPAKYLVNGRSITVERGYRQICYYHLAFDRHEAVYAEGLTVESLLPRSSRSAFENSTVVRLQPEFDNPCWDADGFAPLVVCGSDLERVRDRLAKRHESMSPPVGSPPVGVSPGRRHGGEANL